MTELLISFSQALQLTLESITSLEAETPGTRDPQSRQPDLIGY